MAHDVFISYATQDRVVANAICARLEADGTRCWIAPRDILPGVTWGGAIVRAISEARIMVLILSENANESPQILREVERAVSRGVVIVPVRIQDVIPADDLEYFISSAHWLDAVTEPVDQHLDRIADVVERVLSGPEREDPIPATAARLAADVPDDADGKVSTPAVASPGSGRKGLLIGGGAVVLGGLALMQLTGEDGPAGPPARCEDAQLIAIGAPVSGELWNTDFLRDGRLVDYYSFEVEDEQFLKLTMESGQVDSYLQLFDDRMAELEVDDDSGEGVDAAIVRAFDPGCYVIGAESYASGDGGPYTFTAQPIPEVPGEDIWVAGLRLFEGPSQLPAFEDRVYSAAFPSATTRYLNVELELVRKESGSVAGFDVECVMLQADGTEKGRFDWSPRMQETWTSSYSASGWGQEEPNWVAGTYRVTCTSGGATVAEEFFEVT